MGAPDTVAGLARFGGRRAGTDAERRAAAWLAGELAGGSRAASVQAFWCRPEWALAQAWHVGLALAGSVVTVSDPTVGGIIELAALACVTLDALTGRSPGRRLSPERASQNVVSDRAGRAGNATAGAGKQRPLLLVTAPYDAGRCGVVDRRPPRRLAAWARRRAAGGRLTPGWAGWIAVAIAWLVAVALWRRLGADPTAPAVLQLPPTIGLLLALAALLQQAAAPCGPAANDPGSAAAVAIALVRALDAAPPTELDVRLVLQGAGDGPRIGLQRHLAADRAALRARTTIVLGIAAAGAGTPRWWDSDGPLLALRTRARLRRLARDAAVSEPDLGARAHRGRGTAPAFPARLAGLPAISIGALDDDGLAPRSHTTADAATAVDAVAMDRVLRLALALVDRLDSQLQDERHRASEPAPPAADAAAGPAAERQ